MFRILTACLLFASCGHAVANDPTPSTTPARYTAKVKFLKVENGKEVIAVQTVVTGIKGKPLKAVLGHGMNGFVLRLEMEDVRGVVPAQFVSRFRLVKTWQGKEIVLSQPTLMTLAGDPAKLMIGAEKGDRLEVEFVVNEGVSAANEPKPRGREQTNRKQPHVAVPSSYGTSLMMMVDIPLIIQEEEEEKLGVVP